VVRRAGRGERGARKRAQRISPITSFLVLLTRSEPILGKGHLSKGEGCAHKEEMLREKEDPKRKSNPEEEKCRKGGEGCRRASRTTTIP